MKKPDLFLPMGESSEVG